MRATAQLPAPLYGVERLALRHAPLFYAALAFAAGILLNTLLPWQTFALRIVASLLLFAAGWIASACAPRLQMLCALLLWISAGWTCAGMQPEPSTQTALLHYADGLQRRVQGRITEIREAKTESSNSFDISPAEDQNEATSHLPAMKIVDVQVAAVEEVHSDSASMQPVTGGARLLVPANVPLHCGDSIDATMRLRLPRDFRDPGVWRYPEYLAGEGIGVRGIVIAKSVRTAHATSLACLPQTAQQWAGDRIARYADSGINSRMPALLRLSHDDAGVLRAMLLGDRHDLQQRIRLDFERTGSFHLLVVAGRQASCSKAMRRSAVKRPCCKAVCRCNRRCSRQATMAAAPQPLSRSSTQ